MRTKALSKEKIIEVAEEIIKNEGVEGLKVRNLSKHTGVAVGTLYNYFSSQEELLEEIFLLSWNKTKIKLKFVVRKKEPYDTKFDAFFTQLQEDVEQRRGIGDYVLKKILFSDSFANTKFDFFTDVANLLGQVLKESPKYVSSSKEEIDVLSQLILLGHLHFNRNGRFPLDLYHDVTKKNLL